MDERIWRATDLDSRARHAWWVLPLIAGVLLFAICGDLARQEFVHQLWRLIGVDDRYSAPAPSTSWFWRLGVLALWMTPVFAVLEAWLRRRRLAGILRELDDLPFGVSGYQAWLCADAPELDVLLARPIGAPALAGLAMTLQPSMLMSVDPRRLRIAMPPIPFVARGRSFRREGRDLLARILAPWHDQIVGVEMGGFRAPGR